MIIPISPLPGWTPFIPPRLSWMKAVPSPPPSLTPPSRTHPPCPWERGEVFPSMPESSKIRGICSTSPSKNWRTRKGGYWCLKGTSTTNKLVNDHLYRVSFCHLPRLRSHHYGTAPRHLHGDTNRERGHNRPGSYFLKKAGKLHWFMHLSI